MVKRFASYFPEGISMYVPGMQYHSDVHLGQTTHISFGTPAPANATAILSSAAITNLAGNVNAALATAAWEADARYGRCITVKGDTAGDNAVVTVVGEDYLGQRIVEAFTLSGTGSIASDKAFKRILSATIAAGNANASSSIDIGTSDKLGLPFKTVGVHAEYARTAAGVTTVAAAGTLVQPDVTDPATSTTGDPRGTYDPTTTLLAGTEIWIRAFCDNAINADGNGGYHGIAQHTVAA